MSLIWFFLMACAYGKGYEITSVDFLAVPMFYIGDMMFFTRK